MSDTTCPARVGTEECGAPSDPKSNKELCPDHKREARIAHQEMIAESMRASAARKVRWRELYTKADEAGQEAAKALIPTPMVVEEHADQFDDTTPVVASHVVSAGPCGFAWIELRPGNSSFALWLKAQGLARKGNTGGVNIRVHGYGQSLQLKKAYADAFVKVLWADGFSRARSCSRLD
jgi:hypothetical protein